jgi:hypothetical protein
MDASIPIAAAIVAAIFSAGCGWMIGNALRPTFRIVDRDPDDEPAETIEDRARKSQ